MTIGPAAARRDSTDRLHEVCAFSIFESIAFDMPTRCAREVIVRPLAMRYSRVREAMTRSSSPGTGATDTDGSSGSGPGAVAPDSSAADVTSAA